MWVQCECLRSVLQYLEPQHGSNFALVKDSSFLNISQLEGSFIYYVWDFFMKYKLFPLQVNLCHKLLFLHQLTNNMTTDCSLNYKSKIHENSKLKPGEYMFCTEIVSDIQNNFCTQHVLPLFCKNKRFWQRFACINIYLPQI